MNRFKVSNALKHLEVAVFIKHVKTVSEACVPGGINAVCEVNETHCDERMNVRMNQRQYNTRA